MNEIMDYLPNIKSFSAVFGVIGGFCSAVLGGWDIMLKVLLGMMIADYITGCIVAGLFHNSPKTANGRLESNAGFKGIARKVMILVMVGLGAMLDMAVGMELCRDMVVMMYIGNEAISIIENAGLMGVEVPPVLQKAIDILQKTENQEEHK